MSVTLTETLAPSNVGTEFSTPSETNTLITTVPTISETSLQTDAETLNTSVTGITISIPKVTETLASVTLRESGILDIPTNQTVQINEPNEELCQISSTGLEDVSIEVSKPASKSPSNSSMQQDLTCSLSVPHQGAFNFLSDKIATAQNDEKPLDNLSVNAGVNEEGSSIVRKSSFMKRITTRRRTVRTGMNTAHIHRAAGYSKMSGKLGHVLSAEEKLRMYTMKEIVNTEEEYVQLLQFIVETIVPKLNECAKDIEIKCVSQDTVDKLLSNIEAIFKLHQKFSAALKEATYPFPYHNHCIGNVFLTHEEEFHVYEQYCANYSNAQKLSYELEEDEKVRQLVTKWKNEVESKTRKLIHLEGFLIAPVQRLCKYPLFLKELAKYTKESHSDFKPVTDAKKMMELVTASVNEAERRKIIFEAIQNLEAANDSWEKSGAVSKQGFMTKRLAWWKGWTIYWFILEEFELSFYCQPTDSKAASTIELTSCKKLQEDATSLTGKPYSFGIEMADKTHFMYCTSEQERQEWMNIIKWKMACIERTRRQSEKPIQTAVIASLSSMMNPTEPTTPNRQSTRKTQKNILSSKKVEKHRSKSLFGRNSRGKKVKNGI